MENKISILKVRNVCILLSFIILLCVIFTLSNKKDKREDIAYSEVYLQGKLAKVNQSTDQNRKNMLLNSQKQWNEEYKDDILKELNKKYKFYDSERNETILNMWRGDVLEWAIAASEKDYSSNMKTFTRTIPAKYFLTTGIKFENFAANTKKHEKKYGLLNGEFLFCTYDNYDVLRSTVSDMTYAHSMVRDDNIFTMALDVLTSIDREVLECKFRGDIKKYTARYFYSNEKGGFYEKDQPSILIDANYEDGLKFTSHTVSAVLDYIVIELNVMEDDKEILAIYPFCFDKATKKLSRVDINYFMNNIKPKYVLKQ